MASPTQAQLIALAIQHDALRLGEFMLKSGRSSPYFFNLAHMDTGSALQALANAYADAMIDEDFDLLFGPAYKGIPLVAVVAAELARRGRDVKWAYNRKEAKDHGEGGTLVGAPVTGRVAILDDVVTGGTAIRQVLGIIKDNDATPVLAVLTLDRQEAGPDGRSAIQSLAEDAGMRVKSLLCARDIAEALEAQQPDAAQAIRTHLAQHGATASD